MKISRTKNKTKVKGQQSVPDIRSGNLTNLPDLLSLKYLNDLAISEPLCKAF